MHFNLNAVSLPMTFRVKGTLIDDDLMRLSDENKPYKIERNRDGEITVTTPVGGIESTHKVLVASELYPWTESDSGGISFGSNAGFHLSDGSCLSPDAAWLSLARWKALSAEAQAGFPPLCPEFIEDADVAREWSAVWLADRLDRWQRHSLLQGRSCRDVGQAGANCRRGRLIGFRASYRKSMERASGCERSRACAVDVLFIL